MLQDCGKALGHGQIGDVALRNPTGVLCFRSCLGVAGDPADGMGGDHDMVLYIALLIPFNELDRAISLALTPTSSRSSRRAASL